jgi:hypothetical protein
MPATFADLPRQLATDGFCILKDAEIAEFRSRVSTAIRETALEVAGRLLGAGQCARLPRDGDVTALVSEIHKLETDDQVTRALYQVLPSVPKILSLCGDPTPSKIAAASGLKWATAGTCPLIRLDRPNRDQFLTPPHQDYWFSLLSETSIVIWKSLDEIDPSMGLLSVVPGSHRGGVIPFKPYEAGHEPFEPKVAIPDSEWVDVSLATDEILIFDQKLLHKSGINRSDKVRVSMQLRFNDLRSAREMTSTFTPMHSSYVKREQERLLDQFNAASKAGDRTKRPALQ